MKNKKTGRAAVWLFIGVITLGGNAHGKGATPKPEPKVGYSDAHLPFKKWNRDSTCCQATGKKIAIASGGLKSSECGMRISRLGGNLVDAAIATSLCLAVERPHSTGIGGGGFMTLHLKGKGDFFVNFRETAPAAAKADMYLDKKGEVIPKKSIEGIFAIATPGMVDGFAQIHKKWGKKKWAEVVQPSIDLAEQGFPVYVSLHERFVANRALLMQDPALSTLFYKDGEPLPIGATLVQAELGKALRLIATEGPSAFYTGAIGKAIVQVMQARGGILTAADLSKYQTKFEKPLEGRFRDLRVISAPPPSAGGMMVLQMLQVLSGFDLNKMTYSGYAHVLAETMKHAYADRSQYIGDPDFFKDRTFETLATKKHADSVRRQISLTRPTPSSQILPTPTGPEKLETTHLSLMDDEGNAISSTQTINNMFGSGVSVPGYGIILNDEMDDFSAKPGVANAFGLTGGTANQIEPGKRPVSSMTPTILLRAGRPVLTVGAPGGPKIISAVLNTIVNYEVFYGRDLKKAVFAPRLHHQWLPDKFLVELDGLPAETVERLRAMGHALEPFPSSALIAAVAWDAKAKQFVAVFDPRDLGGAEAR